MLPFFIALSSSVLRNYFDILIKLFLDLYSVKFLDTSAVLFPCRFNL